MIVAHELLLRTLCLLLVAYLARCKKARFEAFLSVSITL